MRSCGARAVAAALLALSVPVAAGADSPFNGIAIGTSVSAIAAALGRPAVVASEDSGNRFVFPGGTTAYADDDGLVLAVAAQTGSARIVIDGTPRSFSIGTYAPSRADAELSADAEFSTATLRTYRLEPRRDLVFAFGATSQRLEAVTYGEPGQLARLGLLPGDPAAKAVLYRAPRLRSPDPVATAAGPLATTYRITLDRSGAVTGVDVAIASETPAADAQIAGRLRTGRYLPATLDGRPIAATIFVEVRH